MYFYLLSALLSFILTFVVRFFAQKKFLIDIPNERSSHTIPTPRGGGLAIAITWFAAITYLFFREKIEANLYYALLSGAALCIISFIDDVYTLKSLPRFITHALVAAYALYKIGGIANIDLGFGVIPDSIFLNIIAFIGIIWFINLFNFVDGIDGYAASESVFVSLTLFLFLKNDLLLVLTMAVLGFLPWNWDKAKIFMGDIGSTLLGFTFSILAIYYNNTGQFSIFNFLILTSLFWFDATYTLYKRFKNKEQLIKGHKKHLYQRIVQYGYSHQKMVIIAMFINLLFLLLAWQAYQFNQYILLFFCINLILLFIITKLINNKNPFK